MTGSATPVVVMEFFSAGGRLGRGPGRDCEGESPDGGGASPGPGGHRPAAAPPPDLRDEGRALLAALVADLAELPGVRPVAVADPATATALRENGADDLEVVRVGGEDGDDPRGRLRAGPGGAGQAGRGSRTAGASARPRTPERGPAGAAVGAAAGRRGALLWPIAPETGGRLERTCRTAEAAGVPLVSPPASGVRRAARRRDFLRRLDRAGLPVPPTAAAATPDEARRHARELGWPVVVRPGRGAGCAGTTRVAARDGVGPAWSQAAEVEPRLPPIVQPFVAGPPASALLLCDADGGVRPLAFSRQRVRFTPAARYEGGRTPYPHPRAARAVEVAVRTARAVGDLRGLVGVDLVLGGRGPVVMELNPRLTTSYLGLRRHVGAAAAAAALRVAGRPTGGPAIDRRTALPLGAPEGGERPVRFTAGRAG